MQFLLDQASFVPPSTTEEGREQRQIRWENIMTEEFDMLMYLPGITYADLEEMPRFERKHMYNKLIDYFNEKNKKTT